MTVHSDHATARTAVARVLTVAWMAVLLGALLQTAVLFSKTAAGAVIPALKWLPDLAGGVTWSTFVCAGVAIGTAASKGRSAVMGVLGFVSAPFAFSLAKGVQKAVAGVLATPADKITSLVWTIGAVKAVEYAVLGTVLGWLIGRTWARPSHFALTGALTGLTFGVGIVVLTALQGKAKTPALVGTGVNEILFPVGCALVIWAAAFAGRHVAVVTAHRKAG